MGKELPVNPAAEGEVDEETMAGTHASGDEMSIFADEHEEDVKSNTGSVAINAKRNEDRSQPTADKVGNEDLENLPPLTARELVWAFTEDPSSTPMAYLASISVLIVILISTITFVLDTVSDISVPNRDIFDIMEVICVSVFTLEIVVRIACCPSYRKYFTEPFNLVDILAVTPFYLGLIPSVHGPSTSSLAVIRAVRLVRVARVFKVSRYSASIQIFIQAIALSLDSLTTLIYLVSIATVIFSAAMYYAELTGDSCRDGGWAKPPYNDPCVQGETGCRCINPNPFTSIPASFWWAIVTMTTVGYGDLVPVTNTGKFIAAMTMITGMIVLALPISVVGTNFSVVYSQMHANDEDEEESDDEDESKKEAVALKEDKSTDAKGFASVVVPISAEHRQTEVQPTHRGQNHHPPVAALPFLSRGGSVRSNHGGATPNHHMDQGALFKQVSDLIDAKMKVYENKISSRLDELEVLLLQHVRHNTKSS